MTNTFKPRPASNLGRVAAFALVTLATHAAYGQSFSRITSAGPIVTDSFLSTGAAWNDFNADGWLDMLALGETGHYLYVNQGDGTFLADTNHQFLSPIGIGNAALFSDFDNDGYQDLYISNFVTVPGGTDVAHNVLYRNAGPPDYRFTFNDPGPELNASPSASWVDYDQDGDLDLFAAGAATTTGGEATEDLFYRQDHGVLINLASLPFVDQRLGIGTHDTWIDYDGDGDQDLFIVSWARRNQLYRSLLVETGNPDRFDIVTTSGLTTEAGVLDIGSSWGDYDNDGDMDVFLPVLNSADRLYRNNGDGTFERITVSPITSGRSVVGVWGDVDNDGDLDLYAGSQNPALYKNDGNGNFAAASPGEIGDLSAPAPSLQAGNWGDYDNDGDLDLYLLTYAIPSNRSGTPQPNYLYRNGGVPSNSWISVACVGALSNRSAVGAKVSVLGTIDGTPRWQHRYVSGGTTSFVFHGDHRLHFGLGDATEVDSIRIEWPSGIDQVVTNVSANQFLTITEAIPDGYIRSNFYADQTSVTGATSLTVQFTDASLVDPSHIITAWEWDLDNDGTVDATTQHPSWTYTTATDTSFSVRLTVSHEGASSTLIREAYVTLDGIVTSVEAVEGDIPTGFVLGKGYPNPFSKQATISMGVPYNSDVEVRIYNVLGKVERRLFRGRVSAGPYSITWDARDDLGEIVPSGVYFYELTSAEARLTGRIVLVR